VYSLPDLFICLAVTLVMRTTKNLWLVTVLIFYPSEKMFTFSPALVIVVFVRFKLRPTLSLLFLTHYIS